MKMVEEITIDVFRGRTRTFKEYFHWAKVCHRNLKFVCQDKESGHTVWQDLDNHDYVLVV